MQGHTDDVGGRRDVANPEAELGEIGSKIDTAQVGDGDLKRAKVTIEPKNGS